MSLPIRYLISFLLASFSLATLAQSSIQSAPDPSSLPGATSLSAPATSGAKAPQPQPSVVVVIDSSAGSPGFGEMRDAATQFIRSLGEESDVAIVAASDKPTVVADFNADTDAAVKKLADLKPHGAPAIQNAVAFATQRAHNESDSAAIVLFARNADVGLSPQSTANKSPVPVYIIASPASKWNVQAELQQLAVNSGGTAYFPSSDRELRDVVKETANRVAGHPIVTDAKDSEKNLLRNYERIIVRDIPVEDSPATAEAAGGENLLMQQLLVARIRKAKLFPVVVNGADQHAVDSASNTPIGNALERRATVVEFRHGNKAARQFLAGVKGGAKMKLRVVLVDTSTNKPVIAFTREGSYASGLWGGSPEHVQAQAMLSVANQIVDELKRVR
jgi:von Willebrand factor type A domain